MRRKINRNTFFALLLIFIIAAIGKIYQYNFSDSSGFGIMWYIVNAINTNTLIGMNSYDFPVKIYSLFKFLGFQTVLEWSIFFTIIFSIIIFILLLKYKKYSRKEYIYIYFSMFVLSWTVFNANKDLIQLIFLLIMYFVFQRKISNKKKIIISAIIFFIESLLFRDYYIIEAFLLIITYHILSKNSIEKSNIKMIKNLIWIFIIFFIGVYSSKFLSSSGFERLISRREALEEMDNVTTIIQNVFSGNSIIYFIPNYLINFVRICFPIELVRFGPKYIVFFIYQVFNVSILFQSMKNINKNNIIYICMILSYLIMLVASESDFGTLARHQSVLLMFYIELMKSKEGEEDEK